MGKQPVLAYSIAGVAVAIAIAAVAASTLGLTGPTSAAEQTVAGTVAGPALEVAAASARVTAAQPDAANPGGVEYVYVDEPQTGDDDDDDEREGRERERHDDDDREHGGLFGLFRGEHDDDDD